METREHLIEILTQKSCEEIFHYVENFYAEMEDEYEWKDDLFEDYNAKEDVSLIHEVLARINATEGITEADRKFFIKTLKSKIPSSLDLANQFYRNWQTHCRKQSFSRAR